MSEDWQAFCSEAPEKFLAEATAVVDTASIPGTLSGLSREIWFKFEQNKQTQSELVNKISLWMQLNDCIKITFPDYAFFLADSTLTGFGLKDNDANFCLLSKDFIVEKQTTLKNVLQTLRSEHEQMKGYQVTNTIVPVMIFKDLQFDIGVNIRCDDVDAIRNAYLLYCYSQVDWRVKPLAVIIQMWAKRHNVIGGDYSVLSSYPLILMLINFLQCGTNNQVLPSLQNLLKAKFKRNMDVRKLNFFEKFDIPFVTKNQQTLTELLRAFFLYYSNFNYETTVISVRKGLAIPKLQYISKYSRDLASYTCPILPRILIEDPFRLQNLTKNVTEMTDVELLKVTITNSHRVLRDENSVDSIFNF